MKNVQRIDLGLTGYDELFMNDAERKENKLPRIYDVPISEIDDFPDHPFKVKVDEDMDQLVQSIKERGIITPVTLRPKDDGRYEIVSGHRRKKACELAGLDTVKAEVREMTRDEAIILMVESNLQRSTILPSEKAFSYKMRLEAMNRQGQRTDLTYSPLGNKLQGVKSSDVMAEEVGESKNTIFRYIRLTELIPELLQLVDESRIAFRPAVELSYLKKEEQASLLEEISYTDATPSLAQAIKMKKFSNEGKLSHEVIESIMSEEKPNQKEKINIKYEDARKFIPASVPYNKTGDYIMKALEYIDAKNSVEQFNELTDLIADVESEAETESSEEIESTEEPELSEEELAAAQAALAHEKYGALFEQNEDFIGWIKIDGTKVDYPVMQSPNSPDYYLKHSFEKAYSDYGVPYIDEACATGISNNLVIYGHHMKNGTMFSDLCNYTDADFCKEHPIINFDTLSGFGEYQVVAVFKFNTNHEDFRYNEYTQMNEEQFKEFMSQVHARQCYDTGVDAEYGDQLITLSTCEYTYNNGRFVVVAKKV